MTIVEKLSRMPVGAIVKDKSILSVLKRKGLIVDYSWWGYLEWNEACKYFCSGKNWIEYKGFEFSYKYLDGCFNAYLQLTAKGEDTEKVVNPRVSLFGTIM